MGIVNIQIDIFRRTRDLSDGKPAVTRVMKNAFDGLSRKLDTSDLKDMRVEN